MGKEASWNELMKMRSPHFSDAEFRAFLDCVNVKWYVESSATKLGGSVMKVKRNRHGVPVYLKIKSSDGKTDIISVDAIDFYEPWDNYVSSFEEYMDDDWYVRELLSKGYIWDQDMGCFYNKETDDEVCW